MVPDLEIPFIYLLTSGLQDRLVLHSLAGAATLGLFLSVLLTVFIYPPLVLFFFKLDKEKVEEKRRFACMHGSPNRKGRHESTPQFSKLS